MKPAPLPLIVTVALAALMWVVPSVGTQGMGTIGQRFTHPDRDLVDDDLVAKSVGDSSAVNRGVEPAKFLLQDADHTVEASLGW